MNFTLRCACNPFQPFPAEGLSTCTRTREDFRPPAEACSKLEIGKMKKSIEIYYLDFPMSLCVLVPAPVPVGGKTMQSIKLISPTAGCLLSACWKLVMSGTGIGPIVWPFHGQFNPEYHDTFGRILGRISGFRTNAYHRLQKTSWLAGIFKHFGYITFGLIIVTAAIFGGYAIFLLGYLK